jgi:RNA polymerase sigma factor (sigma-70 family)
MTSQLHTNTSPDNTPTLTSNSTATHYQEHRRYVLSVLSRRCGWLEPSRREDLLHDAFVVLLEKQQSGALQLDLMPPGQVRAYLTQTALHKALDERKRASRRRSVSLDAEEQGELSSTEPSIEERVIARDDTRRLGDAVAHLPERRRRVIKLRYFLGYGPQQVQRQLGVSRDVYRHELERGTRAVIQAYAS